MQDEMNFKTEQEEFWAGDFGDDYIQRNQGAKLLASNLNFFTKALNRAHGIDSCIEFGANIGMNLRALQLLFPGQEQHGIEINANAVVELCKVISEERVFHSSILDFEPKRSFDLVLIKGVLIHINPDELKAVYDKLVSATGKYLLIAEYYNPSPVAISYRGHSERLFKRDFAGEVLELYPNLKLIDYGFVYRRDPNFPQDDMTWFLLGK